MNNQAKIIVSKDLEKTIQDVLCPMVDMQDRILVEPYHDEKYLHESKIIHVTFAFLTQGGSTVMIQTHQLDEMERLGYRFVSVDSDATNGMKITFHKQEKFTTI